MLFRSLLTAIVGLGLLSPTSSQADEAIDYVSEDAFVVIRFASPNQYLGNFTDLLNGISEQVADKLVPEITQGLNEFAFLANEADVLDGDASVTGAVYPIEDGGVPVAMFIKHKGDIDAVHRAVLRADADDKIEIEKLEHGFVKISRKGTSRGHYIAKRGELTMYTRNEMVMKKLIADQKAKKPSFRDEIGKAAVAELFAGDVAICLNLPKAVKPFKADMERARNEIKTHIKNIPDAQLGSPAAASLKDLMTAGVDFFFQGIYDTKVAVGRANFSSAGAAGGFTVNFVDGSATDKIMRANPATDLANLGLLPSNEFVYGASNLNFGKWTRNLIELSVGSLNDNKNAAASLVTLQKNFQSLVGSFSLGGENKSQMQFTTIEETEDVAAYRAAWKSLVEGSAPAALAPFLTQSMSYQSNAETIQDRKVDLIKVKFDVKADSAEGFAATTMLNLVFGGMELNSRIAVIENLMLQVTSNDAKQIGQQLERFDSGEGVLGLEDAYADTRDKLDDEANFVVLANGPHAVISVLNMLRKSPIGGFLARAPINFDVKPPKSYAGASIKCAKQELKLKVYVPVSQPRDIVKIFAAGL